MLYLEKNAFKASVKTRLEQLNVCWGLAATYVFLVA